MQNITEPGTPQGGPKKVAEAFAATSITAAVTGIGALVLAILALAGIFPTILLPIATISVGVALLSEGAATSASWDRLVSETGEPRFRQTEMGSSAGAGFVGGGAAVVLGVLALLGLSAGTLLAIAAIVLGASVLLTSSALPVFDRFVEGRYEQQAPASAHDAVLGASGVQALAGASAGILGILALVAVAPPPTLIGVAMVILGGTLVLSGMTLGARAKTAYRR
jgi:hypothetical protein